MKKPKILTDIRKTFGQVKLWYLKNKPTIKFVGGTVLVVGGTVGACIATAKTVKLANDIKVRIDTIENGEDLVYFIEDKKTGELIEVSKEKALANAKKELVFGIAKNYAIPSVIYCGGLALQAMGHKDAMTAAAINASIAAMYKRALDRYQERVVELEGEDVDHAAKVKQVETDENSFELYSELSRVFDDSCLGWCDNAELNRIFICKRLSEAQFILDEYGFLFLNDVYKMLGFPMTSEGQYLGWRKGSTISFGLDKNRMDTDEYARDFWNNRLKYVILDFNVDGNIIHDLDLDPKTCNYIVKE